MHVYLIENVVNNKVYVGMTTRDGECRWQEHLRSYQKDTHKSLYRAMRRYGADKFTYRVVEECEERQALAIQEKYWIEKLNSQNRNYGYNNTPGGDGGDTLSSLDPARRAEILQQLTKSGNEAKICHWLVISPEGVAMSIRNLREFCRTIDVDVRMLWSVSVGRQNHHKGWQCFKIVDGEIIQPSKTPSHAKRSKWTVIAPDGRVYEIENLKSFCLEMGVIYKQMHKVTKGLLKHHRGYTVRNDE